MRLICTLHNQPQAQALSTYLLHHGIENQLEIHTNTDWGSHDYGMTSCTIWTYDEDSMDEALRIAEEFQANPEDPKFYVASVDVQTSAEDAPVVTSPVNERPNQAIGPITLYLLFACGMLFFFAALTTPAVKESPKFLPYTPIYASPVQKALMFDYPEAYEIVDKLVATYGVPALMKPDDLPPQGQLMVQKFLHTPYWHGIYEKVVSHFTHPEKGWKFDAPLFEKIRVGEFWRLFTPCLLHGGIFHILFNMIWLIILGKQMEQRLSKFRYCLFILVAGIVPNIAQYLMSGSDFVGFSGVLCAMLAFIWVRQRRAGWEGYYLQPGTFAFVGFFVLFMFGLQLISFISEISSSKPFAIGIANTAHLAGAAVGYVMGRMPYFAWRS